MGVEIDEKKLDNQLFINSNLSNKKSHQYGQLSFPQSKPLDQAQMKESSVFIKQNNRPEHHRLSSGKIGWCSQYLKMLCFSLTLESKYLRTKNALYLTLCCHGHQIPTRE